MLDQRAMPVWVKICGFTRPEQAVAVARLGVNAIGCVMAPSPRQVTAAQAAEINRRLPAGVERVGVFVNDSYDAIMQTAACAGFTMVQLHGDESPELVQRCSRAGMPVIKAFRLQSETPSLLSQYEGAGAVAYLLDSYVPGRPGGTGVTCDWETARIVAQSTRVILAGGLTAENAVAALQSVRPWGIDANSGVEDSPGVKNLARVSQLLTNITKLKGESQ